MTTPLAAQLRRREILETPPSPDPRHDYLVTLEGGIGEGSIGEGGATRVTVRMVPDRLIVSPDSLARYLNALDRDDIAEALALLILDDLGNELVPRWVEVTVTRDTPLRHVVRVEDRQPDWDNPLVVPPPAHPTDSK